MVADLVPPAARPLCFPALQLVTQAGALEPDCLAGCPPVHLSTCPPGWLAARCCPRRQPANPRQLPNLAPPPFASASSTLVLLLLLLVVVVVVVLLLRISFLLLLLLLLLLLHSHSRCFIVFGSAACPWNGPLW